VSEVLTLLPINSFTDRLVYGYAADNIFPLLSVSVFGEVMSIICVIVYARCSTNRSYVVTAVGGSLLVVVLVSLYVVLVAAGAIHQSKHQLSIVLGYLADVTSLAMDIAPLEKLRQVIATKSADSIPIFISCAIWLNCLLWLLNGIVDDDLFIIVPNVAGLVLTGIPIALYVMYRPGRLGTKDAIADLEIQAAGVASSRASPIFQPIVSPLTPARS
jgi:solute carrier family 50 protein (sugar transporter)